MGTFNPGVAQTSTTDAAATVGLITQDARILASMPNTLIPQQTPMVSLQEIAALSVTQPGSVLKVVITPDTAQALLANINTANRPLSNARVKQYADVFKRGQYVFNGESIQIGIDSDNRLILLNGQHRLSACVVANAPFETVLVVGLPTEVFSTIDRGKTRSHSDVLSVAGFKNTHNIQPAARILVAMEAGFTPTVRSTMNLVTAEDILQYVRANEELLMEAHAVAGRISSVVGGISSAWIIFYVHAYQQRVNAGFSGLEVAEFCNAIETGASLKLSNPALALRQWLGRGGSKRKGAAGKNVLEAATFITTFNKWVEGSPLQQIRPWSADSSDFPSVTSSSMMRSSLWS